MRCLSFRNYRTFHQGDILDPSHIKHNVRFTVITGFWLSFSAARHKIGRSGESVEGDQHTSMHRCVRIQDWANSDCQACQLDVLFWWRGWRKLQTKGRVRPIPHSSSGKSFFSPLAPRRPRSIALDRGTRAKQSSTIYCVVYSLYCIKALQF